jgi:predicted RNase H-like HicB family nuclease
MKAKKRYVVDYERDERGLWVAAVRGVPGCHTQGRTIQQGQERIREALSLFIGDTAENVELVRRVKLAAGLQRRVQRATRAKERARQETANAQEALREAVRGLIDNGFSYADAGELLGVTRQWAHEILSTG